MAPTPRTGLLLLGIALTPLAGLLLRVPVPIGLVYAAFVVVVVAATVDAVSSRRHPTATRRLPDVISRGVPADLSVDVQGPQTARCRVRQPVPPDVHVDPPVGRRGLDTRLVAERRGRHVLPPAAMRVVGPLRLGMSTKAVGEPVEFDVYPDLPAARRLAASVRSGLFRTEGLRSRGPLGLGTEFETLRDYVEGDDIRQVNWLASARLQRPLVNEFRIEQERDVIVVLDAGRLMSAPIGRMTRLDAAVDVAAAMASVSQVLGDRVGVVAFDAAIRVDLPPRRRGADAVARAVFDLEPSQVDSDYRGVFEHIAGRKRAFVLVLTDLLDPAAARPLVAAMPILAGRHVVTVASVADPDIEDALRTVPVDLEGAARAAAAADVVAARAEALRLVRHRAGRVVEQPPDRLSAACVGVYLRAKAAARV
jgi:uncharacterized protein (DUF58 family)